MLHQRHTDALRGCRNGDRPRWRLFRSGVPLGFQTRRLGSFLFPQASITESVVSRFAQFAGRVRVGWQSQCRRPRTNALVLAFCASLHPLLRADTPIELNAPVVTDSAAQTDDRAGSSSGNLTLESGEFRPGLSIGATPPPAVEVTAQQAKESIQWLATKAMKEIPQTIQGEKNWGDTKKVWAGIKVRRDGFKLKTHRRWRELEQGRWIKFDVAIPGKPPKVTIRNVIPQVDPKNGSRRWLIQSTLVAPMKFTARVQRWNLGVKLFSLTLTGDIEMRLRSATSVGFYADYRQIPPGLIIDPRVEHAQLVMDRFEVDRISKIGGDVAEGWGEVLQEVLIEHLVHQQNDRIVSKLNRAIEKERDDLKISWSEWFREWGQQSSEETDSDASTVQATSQAAAN